MSILLTILILGIIIFVHELGHFLMAKYYKMPVKEFAIGMGPRILSKKIGETIYAVRLFPMGGFVNIGGMEYVEIPKNLKIIDDDKKNKLKLEEETSDIVILTKSEIEEIMYNNQNGFFTKNIFSKFVVLIAGVMMNFITSLIAILLIILIFNMVPLKYIPPIIEKVNYNSQVYGILQKNDKILELNGIKINNLEDLVKENKKINISFDNKTLENKKIKLVFQRNQNIFEEEIKLTYDKEKNEYLLGIVLEKNKLRFIDKIKVTKEIFKNYFLMTFEGLKMIITGKVSTNEITGPVGLPKVVGNIYEKSGVIGIINLFVLLSINIGIMNLLPIPALDGGRILFLIPEVLKIKLNKKIEEKIHILGLVILLLFMVIVIFTDILKYFK